MDQGSKGNRGYSFINFTDPAYAAAFKSCYEGRQLSQYSSRKFIAILQAEIQGLEANREHFFTTHAAQEDSGPQTLFLRQPHATPAKSSEVSEQCRGVRLKGAAATPAKSTLSRIASKYCAALVSGEQGQAPPAKKRSAVNFCPYCGGGAEESFKFCQFCGKSLCL